MVTVNPFFPQPIKLIMFDAISMRQIIRKTTTCLALPNFYVMPNDQIHGRKEYVRRVLELPGAWGETETWENPRPLCVRWNALLFNFFSTKLEC